MDTNLHHLSAEELRMIPNEIRVLIVDNNQICLKYMERLLQKCNYRVTTTTRAVHALSLLKEKNEDTAFHMVMTDVRLPDMDGFKLVEEIGKQLSKDLPVILMTDDHKMSDVFKAVICEACHYLIKPMTMETAQGLFQHVVRQNKMERVNFACSVMNETSRDCCGKKKQEIEDEEEVEGQRDGDSSTATTTAEAVTMTKKQRVIWDSDLHQKFIKAVNHLGADKAVPKKIKDLMDDPKLTREHIASHLQKYRLTLRKNTGQGTSSRSQNPRTRSDPTAFDGRIDHLQGLSLPSRHLVSPGIVMPLGIEHKKSSQNGKEQKNNNPSRNVTNLVHHFPTLDTSRKQLPHLHPQQPPLINSSSVLYYNNPQFSHPSYPFEMSPTTNYQQFMLPGKAGSSGFLQDEDEDVEDFSELCQVQRANSIAIQHTAQPFNFSHHQHGGKPCDISPLLVLDHCDETTRGEENNTTKAVRSKRKR